MKCWSVIIVCAVALVFSSNSDALAVKKFQAEFDLMYNVKKAKTDAEKSLAAAAKKAKCYSCHVKGKKKKILGSYGTAMSKYLDKDNFKSKRFKAEPEKAKKEIREALKKLEAQPSDPKNKKSTTFGEQIKLGKLPGTTK